MTKLKLKNITEELLGTFLNAGEVAKKISQKGVKITIKADKSPVTDGDLAVDALLKGKILNLTPGIPIISEETVNLNIKNIKSVFLIFSVILIAIVLTLKYLPEVSERSTVIADLLTGGDINAALNLSALIYYKGYEMAYYGITHYPFGVGFLNMEYLNQFSSVSQISNFLYDLNKDDSLKIICNLILKLVYKWLNGFVNRIILFKCMSRMANYYFSLFIS